MDSTSVYDSGNASDSESWSSSEGEQVIEISSHSRILISPRKTRGNTTWNSKDNRSLIVGKNKAFRSRSDQDTAKTHSQTRRRSFHARKSKSGWARSPRKPPSDNQSVRSNNNDDISGSDSDGELDSGQMNNVSSDDSDASFEADIESPPYQHAPRPQCQKGAKKSTSKSYRYSAATSLDDSMRPHDSSNTPRKEMEELKATLKKLARHDDSDENPISKEPNISSATALHEYLTAATALSGANAIATANQARPTEHKGMKTRQALFHQPKANSNVTSALLNTKSKSMRENEGDAKVSDKLPGRKGNSIGTASERLTFDKKIFSTPPPPFVGPGAFAAGLSLPLQKLSGVGVGSGAQGSRAVLSALKALQDKIGRLEEERESLMQQLSDVKLTARKREAELASSEKKFSYELGQTKESARAAYDALRCDREELKLQLVKSEERRKTTQTELKHFQELTKNLSTKADDLQSQLQISESHRTRLKTELKESENNHKRAVNELQAELTQVRQDLQTAAERNELLEAQFQRESANHAESRERLKDSEQTMASISQLNEKLVAKVMEATEAANQAMKKNKKLQQQIRPSTLLKPTAASRASAAAVNDAASRRTANSTMSQGSCGISPARTLKKKKASVGASSSTSKKKTKSSNNMTLLREANLGKDIPFLLGNSVQPSFSIIGSIQDALRRCDTTYVMPTLLNDGGSTTPEYPQSHQQTVKKIDSSASNCAEKNISQVDDNIAQVLPQSDSSTPLTPTKEGISTATAVSHNHSTTTDAPRHIPPAIKVPTMSSNAYSSPMQSQILEDLHVAVESAEKEFNGLNKRYKDLVAQMEANNRRRGHASDPDKANSSTSAQLSQTLGPLLDELEAKAKQLNLLKQVYQQAASSTINPQRHVVVSPAAIRRKTASLRVLNEYRQLEGAFKNKGSGRSGTVRHPASDASFH